MKFKKIYNMYNKEEEKKNILNLVDEYVKKYGQKEYAEKKWLSSRKKN